MEAGGPYKSPAAGRGFKKGRRGGVKHFSLEKENMFGASQDFVWDVRKGSPENNSNGIYFGMSPFEIPVGAPFSWGGYFRALARPR